MDEKISVLEGIISVCAAVDGGKRKVNCVFIDSEKYKKRDRKVTRFVSYLKEKNVPFQLCEREAVDAFVSDNDPDGGNTHGGVAASVGERVYDSASELLDKCKKSGGYAVYLDGVEDPFNFGYAMRSLYAFGATGVIVPARNWSTAAGICARSSAGASELIDIAIAPDLTETEDRLRFISSIKKRGICLACAAVSSKSVPLDDCIPDFPMLLFIGGEKRGISPEFVDNADILLHIPYARDSVRYSLPTASVAGIFGMRFSSLLSNKS